MRDAVICSPLRTPVGGFGGVFKTVPAADLATSVLEALIDRTGLTPSEVDDVVFGNCNPNSEAPAIGRVAALDAGFPISVPGLQLDRRCGSGLQAVIVASMCVQTGASDLMIAGGAESMSQVEYYSLKTRWGAKAGDTALLDRLARGRVTAGGKNYVVDGGMLETAENLRREYKISRGAQDEWALRSHRRAIDAQESGRFDDEIVPFTLSMRTGDVIVRTDEHPRKTTTLESLQALRPIMHSIDPTATVTAGNASGQNDGAAACIVTTRERAAALGLEPLAKLRGWALAGVEPSRMGIGPVPACKRLLDRLGLSLRDMTLIELNEAFAAQVLAVTSEWGLSDAELEKVNVNGSGISLGHPLGATGVRILATMLHEMRRRGSTLALETMCIGGGQGIAAVFESV